MIMSDNLLFAALPLYRGRDGFAIYGNGSAIGREVLPFPRPPWYRRQYTDSSCTVLFSCHFRFICRASWPQIVSIYYTHLNISVRIGQISNGFFTIIMIRSRQSAICYVMIRIRKQFLCRRKRRTYCRKKTSKTRSFPTLKIWPSSPLQTILATS